MPDMTTEAYWYCLSAELFSTEVPSSDGSKMYTVCHGHFHKHSPAVELDFSCTCPAYLNHLGYCKHVQQVQAKDKYCGWDQLEDAGEPAHNTNGQPVCPKCKGPVSARHIGV